MHGNPMWVGQRLEMGEFYLHLSPNHIQRVGQRLAKEAGQGPAR